MPSMTTADKVVIVTGAARGLGRAYAIALAADGAAVIAADIADCSDTVAEAAAAAGQGGRVIAAPLDVTDAGSALALAETARSAFGRIDALINNAALYGALRGGRFDAIDADQWDATMAVNVTGIWNCCKAVVPVMRQAGGGTIVNVASLAATYGLPFALHYTTSKAAVIGLTRGLARELGRDDIRVNAIAPTAVATEGTEEFFGTKLEVALETIKGDQAIRRTPGVEDIVGTVMWLVSDASGFVTGQTIAVDGGTVML
jgi:NAD(P)-dependent dehydrogenase (short-subunit alcohol dehydrogenase family)